MKKVGIFYFSGTGNTQIVAELIKEEFLNRGDSVDLIRIEDVLKNRTEIKMGSYDLIGIGHPVYGFSAPAIISDFIKAMPKGNGQNVFIFKTAGGVAPINYNASKGVIRKLSKKGYRIFYDRILSIGSNWIVKFDDSVMQQLYQTAQHKVKIMCDEISAGKTRMLKLGFPMSLLIGNVTFFHDMWVWILGKDYSVSSACNLCGKCIRSCPTGNIVERNGKIRFKLSCLWCMRCIYGCPQNAIRHRMLSFFVVSGGYDVKKILGNPGQSGQSTGRIPPFLPNYIKNDDL